MDFTRPEPPALPPGVIATHQPWHQRAWGLACRYRWEALPYYAAGSWWLTVETYAVVGSPGTGEIAAFSGVAALSAAGTVASMIKGWGKAVVVSLGLTTSMGWAAWQAADPEPAAGLIMLAPLATAAGIPYWRMLAAARAEQRKLDAEQTQREHEIEIAKIKVVEAYAASGRIPRQRQAAEIDTVADEDRTPQPGQFPEAPWPGVPDGKSIADPVRFSDRIHVTLLGGHVLLGGGTDFGKSGLVHLVCCDVLACRDAVLMGIDMKYGAVELGVYRHAGARIASTPADALQLLKDVRAEGKRRGDMLGVTVHPNGELSLKRKWTPTPDGPQWVVVIDELAELVDEVPEAAELLRSHTRLLRSMGITIVAGCQITSRRVFGGDTDGRGQYGTRVCVRTFDAGQTNMIMGQGMHGAGVRPDLLQQPGEFVIISRHHDGRTPDRAYLLTNEAIADHVRRHATGATVMPPETEPEAFTHVPTEVAQNTGRLDNATELATDYLRTHGPSTPQEIADGVGWPHKAKSFDTLCRRHEKSGFYGVDKRGRYWVVGAKTVRSNIVTLATRRNT